MLEGKVVTESIIRCFTSCLLSPLKEVIISKSPKSALAPVFILPDRVALIKPGIFLSTSLI